MCGDSGGLSIEFFRRHLWLEDRAFCCFRGRELFGEDEGDSSALETRDLAPSVEGELRSEIRGVGEEHAVRGSGSFS